MKSLNAIFLPFLGVSRLSNARNAMGSIFVQVQALLNGHISQFFMCFRPVANESARNEHAYAELGGVVQQMSASHTAV